MTTRTIAVAALAAVAVAAPAAALEIGDVLGVDAAAVRSALEAQGYVIEEIETDDDEIEVDAMLDGVEWEIEVSAADGSVLEIEREDSEQDDDDDDD